MGRKRNVMVLALLAAIMAACLPGNARTKDWPAVIEDKKHDPAPGHAIEFISEHFLGVPYRASTLGGGPGQSEELTVRLDAVDCFTLLDYVEAIRRADSYAGFRPVLVSVRYRDSRIDWATRRHFFTDWAADRLVEDVTGLVGLNATRRVAKRLNEADDGSRLLPGVAVRERTVAYIPLSALDVDLLSRLEPGDYIGIYSPRPGLDVSHVGILVRRDGKLFFRHAASRPQVAAVVDEELTGYLQDKAGIVVLRARPL